MKTARDVEREPERLAAIEACDSIRELLVRFAKIGDKTAGEWLDRHLRTIRTALDRVDLAGQPEVGEQRARAFLGRLYHEHRLATSDDEWLQHAAPSIPRRVADFLAALPDDTTAASYQVLVDLESRVLSITEPVAGVLNNLTLPEGAYREIMETAEASARAVLDPKGETA